MNLDDPDVSREIAEWLARPADALDVLDRMDCEESLLSFVQRHWSILRIN